MPRCFLRRAWLTLHLSLAWDSEGLKVSLDVEALAYYLDLVFNKLRFNEQLSNGGTNLEKSVSERKGQKRNKGEVSNVERTVFSSIKRRFNSVSY